jgi:WD40 repeat protein
VWDATSSKLQAVLTGHSDNLIAAEISPDGTLLLTHSEDYSARLWNLATGKLAIPPLELGDWVGGAGFSPDGARLVTAAGPVVQVWDVRTGVALGAPFTVGDVARTAMFSPDGSSVLSVGLTAIQIWDAGLDTGSLDDWHRVVRDSSFPQLGQSLDRQSGP